MNWFQNVSIKTKLNLLMMLIGATVLIIACAAFLTYELVTYRSGAVRDMTALGQIIGDNASAALAFNDSAAAKETLTALRSKKHIVAARIYSKTGEAFATYIGDNKTQFALPSTAPASGTELTRENLITYTTINLGAEKVGTVGIQADTQEMRDKANQYCTIAAVIMWHAFS